MHTVKVKICGITNTKEIEILNKYDIDYVGFVFAKSSRKVTVKTAIKLSKLLKGNIKKVGIFVNTKVDEINNIVKKVKLDIVQLHGPYTSSEIAKIQAVVWVAINIKDEKSVNQIHEMCDIDGVSGVLVDAQLRSKKGGTGITFDWELLKGLIIRKPLILAGGLNEANVSEAIKKVRPKIVDVSSGVEHILDGVKIKSEEKVRAFIKEVKDHE